MLLVFLGINLLYLISLYSVFTLYGYTIETLIIWIQYGFFFQNLIETTRQQDLTSNAFDVSEITLNQQAFFEELLLPLIVVLISGLPHAKSKFLTCNFTLGSFYPSFVSKKGVSHLFPEDMSMTELLKESYLLALYSKTQLILQKQFRPKIKKIPRQKSKERI